MEVFGAAAIVGLGVALTVGLTEGVAEAFGVGVTDGFGVGFGVVWLGGTAPHYRPVGRSHAHS